MTKDDYITLIESTYTLISSEFEKAEKSGDLAPLYPKLVIMFEFFTMLRDNFNEIKPVLEDYQSNIYELENSLKKRLEILKEKLDFDDENKRTQFYIDSVSTYFKK